MSTDLASVMSDIVTALQTCSGLNVTTFDPSPNMQTGAAAIVGLPVTVTRVDYSDTNEYDIPVTVKISASSAEQALIKVGIYSTGAESVLDALFTLDDSYQVGPLHNFGTFADAPVNSNILGFDVTITFTG